jgi:hypothetical protein
MAPARPRSCGLDPRSRIDLWDAIRGLVAQGTNVLLTTQYLDEADRLADEIVIIDHGKAIAHGIPAELKKRTGRNVIEVHVPDRAHLAEVAQALTAIGDRDHPRSDVPGHLPLHLRRRDRGRHPRVRRFRRARHPHDHAHRARNGRHHQRHRGPGPGPVRPFRSLPIPRGAVLAGRAVADTATQTWGLLVMAIASFLVGFRLHGGIGAGLLAFALIIVFSFTFEWVFIATGLYAGNAQAAQGMALILVPFTFVSSAYVPVSSMPGGLRGIAEHQPVTYMIEAVRSLTGGERAEALLGHPAGYFVARSLIWSAVLLLVFGAIAVARYRRG